MKTLWGREYLHGLKVSPHRLLGKGNDYPYNKNLVGLSISNNGTNWHHVSLM